MPEVVSQVGHATLAQLAAVSRTYDLFRATLYCCARLPRPFRDVPGHMYVIGNQSVFFLMVVMGFIGAIAVYQGGIQLQRVIPDMTQLGPAYLELLIKDLSPTLSALMLATRVGAGIAAELGAMVVTEQVDALRMCAADPVDFLIRPRFIASLLMTVFLVIISTSVAGASGTLTAQVFFEVQTSTFLNFDQVDGADILEGSLKCFAYGATIPIVSGYCGLTTRGGSEGVGAATTRAVVGSSLSIIALDFLISALVYISFR